MLKVLVWRTRPVSAGREVARAARTAVYVLWEGEAMKRRKVEKLILWTGAVSQTAYLVGGIWFWVQGTRWYFATVPMFGVAILVLAYAAQRAIRRLVDYLRGSPGPRALDYWAHGKGSK